MLYLRDFDFLHLMTKKYYKYMFPRLEYKIADNGCQYLTPQAKSPVFWTGLFA
jgi:hypothetical protein